MWETRCWRRDKYFRFPDTFGQINKWNESSKSHKSYSLVSRVFNLSSLCVPSFSLSDKMWQETKWIRMTWRRKGISRNYISFVLIFSAAQKVNWNQLINKSQDTTWGRRRWRIQIPFKLNCCPLLRQGIVPKTISEDEVSFFIPQKCNNNFAPLSSISSPFLLESFELWLRHNTWNYSSSILLLMFSFSTADSKHIKWKSYYR